MSYYVKDRDTNKDFAGPFKSKKEAYKSSITAEKNQPGKRYEVEKFEPKPYAYKWNAERGGYDAQHPLLNKRRAVPNAEGSRGQAEEGSSS